MKRYFIEKTNLTKDTPSILELSESYHCVQISSEYTFGIAIMSTDHFDKAWDHDLIFVFPSMHDHRPILGKLKEQKLEEIIFVLRDFDILETDSCREALLKITDKLDSTILELPE